MPVHESNQVRSAQRARSYEGSASVANPTAARRSWPRGSRTGYSITWSTLRGMEGMAFHSSFNDRYSPRHEGSVNLGAGDTAVREGDSIAVSTQGLQITRFSRSARTSSALKPARLFRALEIGEEDGDLLTLALERSLGGEDLLGQVLRSVGLGRGEPRLSCYLRNNRLPTLQAELRSWAAHYGTSCRSARRGLRTPDRTSPEADSRAGTGDTSHRPSTEASQSNSLQTVAPTRRVVNDRPLVCRVSGIHSRSQPRGPHRLYVEIARWATRHLGAGFVSTGCT